jgi:hypothetical protein
VSTSEQSHELKAGAPSGDPQQYVAYEIQDFFQATDPSGVGAVGQQHQMNGSYALLIASDLSGQGKSLFDKWQGPAAEVAQTALAQLANTAQRFGEASNQFGTALSDYGGKLGTYKNISWPLLSQDMPPKPGQLTALNKVAQQAMAQANGDMQAAWSAMPSTVVSELPGISNAQSGTTSNGSAAGTSYSPPSGSHYTGSTPGGTTHQTGSVPPGTTHQPGSTTTPPPGATPPGSTPPGSTPPGTVPPPSHLSSAPPPGTPPGSVASPPPGSTTLPPPGVSTPPPGSPPPSTIGPGPILSSTPPPSPEDPNPGPGALPPGEQSPVPPGEEPLPNMIRPFSPGPEPVVPPGSTGRIGPNSSVEASAPVAQDFAGPGTGPGTEAGVPGAMAAQDESLSLGAAEMGQRDMLGMPMAPMGPMGGDVPGSQEQARSLSVTEGREVWSDDIELHSPVIGDAPNYLGLTGRRPIRPEPGARLSTTELERLLNDAVANPEDRSHGRASIPGEISSLLDGVDAGVPLSDGTIRNR